MAEENISSALNALADCEQDMEEAENEVQLYRMNHLKGIYEHRDAIIQKIPNFWKIVLSQNDDFANYIRASDFKYVDVIDSLLVEWNTPNDYFIIVEFKSIENDLKAQVIRKHFVYQDEQLTSEPVQVEYPVSTKKGTRSIFDWFSWTGSEELKEFANGADFAALISEDLYPYCVKYYIEAQRDVVDEESCTDSSEGELLGSDE